MSGFFALFEGTPRNVDSGFVRRFCSHIKGAEDIATLTLDGALFGVWNLSPRFPSSRREASLFQDDYVVLADARLDNRASLIDTLGLGKAEDAPQNAELILNAYLKWGTASPSYLLGDFAYLIYNPQDHTLFCARDIVGVRPFYYSAQAGSFACCSQLKPLVKTVSQGDGFNESKLVEYATGRVVDRAATLYPDIQRLPPAHSMSLAQGRIRLHRYWRLAPQPTSLHAEEWDEQFAATLTTAVQCRLEDTSGVGTYLSGGVDSTAITHTTLSRLASSDQRLHSYTWALAPEDTWTPTDCREEVDAFLAAQNLSHTYIHTSQDSFFDGLPPLHDFFCGPNAELRHYFALPTYRLAHTHQVETMLAGDGGDACASFLGHNALLALLLAGEWSTLVHELHATAKHHNASFLRMAVRHLLRPLLHWPSPRLWADNSFSAHTTLQNLNTSFFQKSHLSTHKIRDYFRDRTFPYQNFRRAPVVANQIAQLDDGSLERGLEGNFAFADAEGIRHRFPLLDRRLLELVLSLPPSAHVRNGQPRALIQTFLKDRVPPQAWVPDSKHAVVPDLVRRIQRNQPHLAIKMQLWKTNDSVASRLNLTMLQRALSLCQQAYPHVPPLRKHNLPGYGQLVRTLMLAHYLETL